MVDATLKIGLSRDLKLTDIPETIKSELIGKLTIPNPKWLENARMGRWNKNVPKLLRFFHRHKETLWIPRGYLRQLIMMCRQHNISYHIDDLRRKLPSVNFSFQGELKSFQKEAVGKMLARDFGTLNSPTGSGKTVMGLFMIAHRQQPALVVVHTKDLAYQWIEQIKYFLGIEESHVGLIGSGKKKIGDAITVALVQSLYRCADDVSKRIGHIIVDECHRTPSRTFTDAVTEFDARYMLGLSATPFRRDNLSKLIFWHLGDVHHSVDKSRLIQEGHILKAEIIFRETKFEPYYDPVNSYSKMLLELTMSDERNHLIVMDVIKEIQKREGICLVLSDRKRHCETLQSLLRYKHHVEADLLTGDLSNEQRKNVLQRIKTGEIAVVVATGQLVGEGFDCPKLTTLFLATPIRFSGRVLQYLGRILRPATDKNGARVYDYVDVNVGVLNSAAKHRQKVYESM